MTLAEQVNADIKDAMKAKEREKLDALRAVKSALLLAATEKGANNEVSEEAGIQVIQRLIKQRNEAAEAYLGQNRQDLADVELAQVKVIEKYMPEQLSEEEVEEGLKSIIAETGASSMKDMGKVMGMATKKFSGKADNKLVSQLVRKMLS
ncbi:GatB/YqeY domain-containing protein [bacterium SCSIO 12741]|nr:GatB/YqeY domain-containing protein [bacterium SCSIO 12741]